MFNFNTSKNMLVILLFITCISRASDDMNMPSMDMSNMKNMSSSAHAKMMHDMHMKKMASGTLKIQQKQQ